MKLSKLDKVILCILKAANESGMKDLSTMQVHKLVYLLEVESRRFVGDSFFANEVLFQRQLRGPISVQIYNSLKYLEVSKLIQKNITNGPKFTAPRNGYLINKQIQIKQFLLSSGDMAFLSSVLSDYLLLNQHDLTEQAYKTEPMIEIQSSESKVNKKLTGHTLMMNLVPVDNDLLDIISENA